MLKQSEEKVIIKKKIISFENRSKTDPSLFSERIVGLLLENSYFVLILWSVRVKGRRLPTPPQ
jgi:hypothetical protein